ncbi:hypothetical protein SAMN05880501_106132 [Ureibacillus xyleni]|uniref:Uncharacterized protein n=1 Tax=Ureibacillus xyleni TaxID=614648 RepID=A0A285SXE1_9BACL|nr:hypothetical protein [Ureibacillus xyleni]SOC11343.1 hypothetical protein SAMN05880501_106132 [Ureibacillus xyleni]
MYIKHIVWRRVIFGQVRRLTLGMNVPESSKKFKKLRADHALEWGNNNENPGVWSDFVGLEKIPVTPKYFSVPLDNSKNNLKLWQGANDPRGNKVKISQRLWTEPGDIIDIWYLGTMKLLNELLEGFNETEGASEHSQKLHQYVSQRLRALREYKGNLYEWAKDTQDQFHELILNPDFLFDDYFIKTRKAFIEHNYFLVICYEDENGQKFNHALMANIKDSNLHPVLSSRIKGSCGASEINQFVG